MTELYYAGLIIEITGFVGIAIGLFECLTHSKTAFGYGRYKAPFKPIDVRAYNKAVGKLWLVTGTLVCLDGLLLLTENPEKKSVFVALSIVAIYTLGAIYYVLVIQTKHSVDPKDRDLWKDVKKKK